ncbi:PLP-dependent aminotransferase family protein [Actinocrispum sp. NPDC049592]|uniref:MocR-like pyridoxine biosynthesis transcription factor PdxR n=1 Tax=Actinocrispum sp. NPDC049592 TaxID=3154835 RepID=UPI00344026C0
MEFHVSLVGRDDLTGQIFQQVRAAILDGRLRAGDALPPTRELAQRLAVSRNTVSAAYDRLTAEGFLEARTGSGTFVREAGLGRQPEPARGQDLRALPVWDTISPPRPEDRRFEFDFRIGIPDMRLFPFASWRRILARQFTPAGMEVVVHDSAASHPALSAALARHIGVSRAVRASADDVLVTNGAQQAVDLVARILLEPGTVAAVEDPGYIGPRDVFRSQGATVVGVPVDDEGIVVSALPSDARLVYVTPSHQFPLGMPMSLSRRTALLDWAERTGAVIIEDDYDSEFRFGGRPIEPLQNLDRSGRVVYVGSLSKVLMPPLRMGFLIAPPSLRPALRAAKYVNDWHSTRPMQATLAEFIDEGLLARHIRRTRSEYRARHELITAIFRRDFADVLTPVPVVAGMHVSAYLTDGPDDVDIVKAARRAGVAVHALSPFSHQLPGRTGLALGYGGIQRDSIEEGLRRLRACISSVRRAG